MKKIIQLYCEVCGDSIDKWEEYCQNCSHLNSDFDIFLAEYAENRLENEKLSADFQKQQKAQEEINKIMQEMGY